MDKLNGKFKNATENILLVGSRVVDPREVIEVRDYMETDERWTQYYRDAQGYVERELLMPHTDKPTKKVEPKPATEKTEKRVVSPRAEVQLSEAEVDAYVNQSWKVLSKDVETIENLMELKAYLEGALRLGKSNAVISVFQRRINTLEGIK